MIIGLGTDFWGSAIYILPNHMNLIDSEFIQYKYKLLPLILSLSGSLFAFLFYNFFFDLLINLKFNNQGRILYNFFNKKWYFDKLYNELIVQGFFNFSFNTSYKLIDRGIIEALGPMGLSLLITKNSEFISKAQTGFIYHYTFIFLIGSTIILGSRQFWILFGHFSDYRLFIIFIISLFTYFSNVKT